MAATPAPCDVNVAIRDYRSTAPEAFYGRARSLVSIAGTAVRVPRRLDDEEAELRASFSLAAVVVGVGLVAVVLADLAGLAVIAYVTVITGVCTALCAYGSRVADMFEQRHQAARLLAAGCGDEEVVETLVRCDRDGLPLDDIVDRMVGHR